MDLALWIIDAMTGWLGAALGWLAAGGAIWFASRRNAKKDAALDDAKQEIKAHERINQADIGVGASDADRIAKLQRMGQRWERD